MNFEDQLRTALRREEVPPGFAARVLAATPAPKARVLPFWRRPLTLALAAALVLAALAPPAIHFYTERQRALEAREQLLLAFSITRVQLQQAREKIRENTRRRL